MKYSDNIDSIHIGQEIRKRLDKIGMPYKEFASRLHCSRSALYYLFQNETIDIKKLIEISNILNYDFIGNLYLKSDSQPEIFIAIPADSSILNNLNINNIKSKALYLKHSNDNLCQ